MNKLQSLMAVVGIGAIAIGTAATFNQPSYAQSTTFFCGMSSDGVPTTFANTPRGTVQVVKWTSEHFTDAGYSPERRCQEVSSRFQSFKNRGQLNSLTAGYLNGQPAICVGDGNPPCTSEKLLFTLKPGANAAARLQQLFDIRSGASGAPLYESTRDHRSSSGSSATVDFNQFLQQASVVQASGSAPNSAPNSQPANIPAARQPNVQPSNGGGGNAW
ncbi:MULTISPECIES: COP23 domain-containing protein [unclassified Microcoleus]|uniref:COP23 domain-containing protein n=1 Tax=unclassified Microcoleus TaxID=2642155 RepID=UPI002FD07EEF